MNPQEKYFAVLHTSKKTSYSDENTLIFSDLKEVASENDFDLLKAKLNKQANWLGYYGYELGNSDININYPSNNFIETPPSWFGNFAKVEKQKSFNLPSYSYSAPKIVYIKSNMNKQQYISKVNNIKEKIVSGDLYQANLTRKFFGEFAGEVDAFAIYCHLNKVSPAPYSAYIKIDDLHIISSSPELFLRINKNGEVVTCPIKGSAAKGQGGLLSSSDKDIAENLMITDLMRNDLARNCIAGSVKVDKLFEVNDFATISHMHSTISGKLGFGDDEVENQNKILKLIKDCSPAGSMTGAPKIAAMKLCAELESWQRGIYSGALGYLDFGDEVNDILAEFSVVIRTIIIKGNKFEFQVGGGIVHESEAEKEYNETLIKASAICNVLGLDISGL